MNSRTLVALGLAGLMIASTGIALAERGPGDHGPGSRLAGGDHGPRFEHGPRGMWVLKNDNITIWFHQGPNGKAKPQLRVFETSADGNVTGYSLDIKRILEVKMPNGTNDTNRDDLTVIHSMNLARMGDWNVQITNNSNTTTLTMIHAEQRGIITLAFHIDDHTPKVKFDVDVSNWGWGANASDHHLVLDLVAHSAGFSKTDREDRVSLGSGFIEWSTTASEDGKTVPVTHATAPGDCGREQKIDSQDHNKSEDRDPGENCSTDGRLALVFGGTGGYKSLAYDPTLGVQSASISAASGSSAVPFIGAIAVVGAMVAVAIVVARRKA